jgi:fido (protein-threonine AMPylation protein)
MTAQQLTADILDFLTARARVGLGAARAALITAQVQGKRPTVNRRLAALVAQAAIVQEGAGPMTGYRMAAPLGGGAPVGAWTQTPTASQTQQAPAAYTLTPTSTSTLPWSAQAFALRAHLTAPIGTRTPVTYRRQFVDDYVPNLSSLLPAHLAHALFNAGRSQGQQPASTYARKVLEPLLIDLSWHSSRLEGNRLSLLDTQTLFAKGRSATDDDDTTMLLNHKDAIEFMVDAVPDYGVTVPVVRNIQSLLMQGLLDNPDAVGAIRQTVVNITDSVYVPSQVPSLLGEMLGILVEKAQLIKNPVEAAFFLWLQVAYLQPFEDGNKRTSRLCANLPLMLANCAPLSFLDVERGDYALAVMGVYERQDAAMAVDLFEWTYRRSIAKYQVMLASVGSPDPFRAQYREHLAEAIRQVVVAGATLEQALAQLSLPAADGAMFRGILRRELQGLEPFNCARYRLSLRKTEDWIQRGRPQ